ncbi:asparagine synthetase B family protein [uncultured Polaribacter sp.]|uniref:asparagine synthetase B family protein n=1 Tax=uncultured Polaribacter sp. TaxID=174711 RepID=UPI002607F53F|nr:asparagine synthetase B family protein [uncultured Polaribacter sp.]
MNITLNNNLGFSWSKTDTISFKGYFYIKNDFYEKQKAIDYLSKIKTKTNFKDFLKTINGVFTIIINTEKNSFIASDITRSFAVFYTLQNNELFLSDDIFYLKNTFNLNNFDALSEIEFKATNHTHGKKTLLQKVHQVQASEYLIVKNDTIIERDFFYTYAIEKESSNPYSMLKEKATIAFENAFGRFVESLNNRTIVVPLSGGFDSRLIAVMLKKHNYKNVVCYTYGRKNSFEIENSKKTAKALGFQWFFIEYNSKIIKNYLETDAFKKYAHFAGKLSSMPYLQEYFAVKYLKENKLIALNSIFVPGYAGDFLGGSQFLKVIPEGLKKTKIISLLISKKFSNHQLSKSAKKVIKQEIEKTLIQIDGNYKRKIPSSVFEDYDLKEKIAKYIFNSANFYTYFGFEHRFPFWDKELLDFFKKVPVKYKLMKILFDDVLINNYFKPYNVCFKTEIQPSEKIIYIQKIKDKIKPILPTYVKQKILEKNDWHYYKAITNQMLNWLKLKGVKVQRLSKNYNEVITQWYLYFSKKE